MAISGPRLDRPSAIGDEGRPRAASLWLATLVIVVLVGGVGIAIGGRSLVVSLVTVVGMAVAGIGLLERDRLGFVEQFGSHALLVTFGSATALLVVVAPFVTRAGIAVSGFTLALLGIGITWANVGSDGLKRSVEGAALTYVSMLFAALIVGVMLAVGFVGWRGLGLVVDETSPLLSLAVFLLGVAATASATLLALRWLPLVQLTRRDRRPSVKQSITALHRLLLGTILGVFVALVVLLGLGLGGWLPIGNPIVSSVLTGLSTWYVLGPLLAITVVSVLLGLLAVSLRRLTRRSSADATRRSAAITVGVTLVLLAPIGLLLLFVSPVVVWLLALVLSVGPIVFVVVGACGVCAIWLGLLPDRTSGPAIAAAGLVIAAIGVGRSEPVLAFACIASAALVWDLTTFGLGVTGELGHVPETRRLELFHGVLAAGIGVGALLVAIGLETLRTGAFAGIGGSSAVAIVALGALVLLVPLRG